MNIYACVDVGGERVKNHWERSEDGKHLIVKRIEDKAIAIRLDDDRVIIQNAKKMMENVVSAPNHEQREAVIDYADWVYLGTLSIADAVLIPN